MQTALQEKENQPRFASVPHRVPCKTDDERFRVLVVEDDLNIARLLMANLAK
jgi:hypothetical protein